MVQGYSGATGRYRFQALNFELPDRNLEPNDIREQASPVNLGTPAEAYLMSSEDADWYRISISGNGRFTVYTEGGTDTLLSLYDGNGNLLAEDDDSGAGGNARISRNISGGTFFIKVMPYGGDDGGSSGPYTLRTALNGTPALDGFEPDDRVDQAGDIAVGDSQTRTFTDGDDIDWARLRVTRPGRYVIRAGGEKKNELDTYIELFDAANSLVAQDDDGGGNYDSLLNVELQSGTYYIKVSTLDDEPEDRYILSVEAE
jgi:serralysin